MSARSRRLQSQNNQLFFHHNDVVFRFFLWFKGGDIESVFDRKSDHVGKFVFCFEPEGVVSVFFCPGFLFVLEFLRNSVFAIGRVDSSNPAVKPFIACSVVADFVADVSSVCVRDEDEVGFGESSFVFFEWVGVQEFRDAPFDRDCVFDGSGKYGNVHGFYHSLVHCLQW